MTMVAQQTAILQALARLEDIIDFPPEGSAVLDLSDEQSDVSGFFVDKNFEAARLEDDGAASDTVAEVKGTPSATNLSSGSLDLVAIAGDRARICHRDILFEAGRILKTHAALVLVYASPVSLPGTVVSLSQNLAVQFNPFWRDLGDSHAISPHLSHLAMSGFVGGECHSMDSALSFTRDEWVSYCCTHEVIQGAGLSPAELQDFRLVLHDYIKRDFGTNDFYVPFRALAYMAYKAD